MLAALVQAGGVVSAGPRHGAGGLYLDQHDDASPRHHLRAGRHVSAQLLAARFCSSGTSFLGAAHVNR